MIYDVLVVGSGASAVNAAFPLVEAGLSVGMLDFGNEDQVYGSLIPNIPFYGVRKTDERQHRYFLGDRFEGIPFGPVRVGSQLTPPRQYIVKDAQELTPIHSRTFFPIQSLALGGMASGWGAGAAAFDDRDLIDFPISLEKLVPHYQTVAERIGISGERDDLLPFYGDCKTMLPPLRIDRNAQAILDRYNRQREILNGAGFYMGKPRLAALSQPYRQRGPDRYLDMSFWSDADQSVWRPRYTLQELQSYPNFIYLCPFLVEAFKQKSDGTVEVTSKRMDNGQSVTHTARILVLGAGTLGTTRIVLRSFNRYGVRVPFVCNSYTWVPMLNLSVLGELPSEERHSLGQLCVIFDPRIQSQSVVHAHVHSYSSLLNFKIMKEMPIPYREGMRVTRMLVSSLAILAIDHEDRPTPDKNCMLLRDSSGGPDQLEITYSLSDAVSRQQRRHEKAIVRHFRKLRCLALRMIRPRYGASLHYGGTFPMSREERELTVDTNGRLCGTMSVHLVDSSIFPYLPAKGMTFTMMANANRIGAQIRQEFKR